MLSSTKVKFLYMKEYNSSLVDFIQIAILSLSYYYYHHHRRH